MEVLAAGHIKMQQLVVEVWMWDEALQELFYKEVAKIGGADRMLYGTIDKSSSLQTQDDLLNMAPTAAELKQQAAKGKGGQKGSGANKGDKSNGKGGGDGGASKGDKNYDGSVGGRIPAILAKVSVGAVSIER